MATATKPKPKKIVDSSINGKPLNSEILLVNTLNSIQLDIRELRTDIKRLDDKVDLNLKWTLGIMATLIAFVFTVMFFLHSDLKYEIKGLKFDVKQNSKSINQINQKLDKLLGK